MPLANLYGVTFKSKFQRCYNRQTIARDMNEAVAEAKELCIKLSVAFVDFNFNGIKISVREDTNIESHVNAYVNRNTKTDHII